MLHIHSGLPGGGKTLYTIWYLKKYLVDENKAIDKWNADNPNEEQKKHREIYAHNISGLKLPWNILKDEDVPNWYDLPAGSIIVFDEAQHVFPNMSAGSVRPKHYMDFTTHRHRGFDIFLITQNPSLLDFKVRSMAGAHTHLTRSHGMPAATVYKFSSVQDVSKDWYKQQDDVLKSQWKYPKSVYEDYKSAEIHTHKMKLPWFRLAGVAAAGLLSIGLIYTVMQKFVSESEHEVSIETTEQNNTQPIRVDSPAQVIAVSDLSPSIPGLPNSAPVYRNYFSIAAAPRVDGCSALGNSCTCNDQRGNYLDVPESFCRSYIERGFFDFTMDEKNYQRGERSGPAAGSTAVTSSTVSSVLAPSQVN